MFIEAPVLRDLRPLPSQVKQISKTQTYANHKDNKILCESNWQM